MICCNVQLPVKMVRAGQHATVATHPTGAMQAPEANGAQPGAPQAQDLPSMPAIAVSSAAGLPTVPGSGQQHAAAAGQKAPADEREVFRIQQPCGGQQGTPPQGTNSQHKDDSGDSSNHGRSAQWPKEGLLAAQSVHGFTAATGAHVEHVAAESAGTSMDAKLVSSRGRRQVNKPGSAVKSLLQMRAAAGSNGSASVEAAAASAVPGLGTGMAEGFGVGSSALESTQPEEFGGMQIEWAAGSSRWAVRSNSAPSLVASLATNSRKVIMY